MDDTQILGHINELVAEEKKLRAAHAGSGLQGEDKSRLDHLEQQLDQAWDLLRQRRAHEEFNENPDTVSERSIPNVEGYLQ